MGVVCAGNFGPFEPNPKPDPDPEPELQPDPALLAGSSTPILASSGPSIRYRRCSSSEDPEDADRMEEG